jgi:ubiquinone/menaquinone biosynthesis C-methylase UbiE
VSWRDYWNSETPIYVSERHMRLHYRRIASDLITLLDELFPGGRPVVLDHGCGQALDASRLAVRCERLYLLDSAPTVVEALRRRVATDSRIAVLHDSELATLPDASLDAVVVNSVVQYLSREEFGALLSTWRVKLKPGGTLALADILPRHSGPLSDAFALLRFAAQGGFLIAALNGLVRTALSDYRTLRGTLGLAQFDEAEMSAVLGTAGFTARRRLPNVGHNPARMTFLATISRGQPASTVSGKGWSAESP